MKEDQAVLEDLTEELVAGAWERVAENHGGPGVDGMGVEAMAARAGSELGELRAQAAGGRYRAMPLRKIVIEKRPGSRETRTLRVPTVRDRILQTAFARILSRSFEEEFLEGSYAYRPGRGVDRAVARMLELRDRGYTEVVDADITGYFDNIHHGRLLARLGEREDLEDRALGILKQWVEAEEWDGKRVVKVKRGISQGSPISPLLANLYLTPLDVELSKGDQRLVRYSDDFVILCRSRASAEEALEKVGRELMALGLTLKREKTRLTSFGEGFRFLGVVFRGGEAMVPWKAGHGMGRVVFAARPMTGKQLRPYRAAAVEERPVARKRPAVKQRAAEEEGDVAYLYLTQPGTVLRKSGDRFLVERDGEIARDLPYHRLEQILVFGNAQVTSQAMAEALEHGIGVSLFSRQGRYRGSLTGPFGKNVRLRLRQYELHQDAGAALGLAKACIRWKVENGLTVLERYEERNEFEGEAERRMEAAMEAMTGAQGQLEEAGSVEEAMGLEGVAARAYFNGLACYNRSEFEWQGRKKHPSPDPLNALLSLSYTLLLNELAALLEAEGLDPAVGYLHEIDGGRPSLALDLLEPFRAPAADRLVWTLVNRKQFRAEDFERRDENSGLYLRPDGMRRYLEAYERWMLAPVGGGQRTFRGLLRAEAERFVESLRSGKAWEPFSYRSATEVRDAGIDRV